MLPGKRTSIFYGPRPNSKGKNYLVGQSSKCSECLLIHSGTSNPAEFHQREEERKGLRILNSYQLL